MVPFDDNEFDRPFLKTLGFSKEEEEEKKRHRDVTLEEEESLYRDREEKTLRDAGLTRESQLSQNQVTVDEFDAMHNNLKYIDRRQLSPKRQSPPPNESSGETTRVSTFSPQHLQFSNKQTTSSNPTENTENREQSVEEPPDIGEHHHEERSPANALIPDSDIESVDSIRNSALLHHLPPDIQDLILWKSPVKSAVAFFASLFVISVLFFGPRTFLSMACDVVMWTAIGNMVYVFGLQFIHSFHPSSDKAEVEDTTPPPKTPQKHIVLPSKIVDNAALLTDAIISSFSFLVLSESKIRTVKTIVILYVLSRITNLVSFGTAMLFVVFAVFVGIKVYSVYQLEIAFSFAAVYEKLQMVADGTFQKMNRIFRKDLSKIRKSVNHVSHKMGTKRFHFRKEE